jgi:hypothetical protein
MADRQPRFRYLLVAAIAAAMVVVTAGPATPAQGTSNPPWRAHCPARVGILVDQSASMAERFGDVRTAVGDVVDALRDKRSEVTIVGFGTAADVIAAGVDVSDSDKRRDLKTRINNLGALDGNAGGTNWQAALDAVVPLRLDVVVLVTDGLPDVYGNPYQEGPAAVNAAVTVADQLKADGTRVAAVGIDLQSDGVQNLQDITGPLDGQDYYSSDTSGLLHHLYQIVASTCGVPIAALPTPEPPTFPWLTVILAVLGGLVLVGAIGFVLSRRRGGPAVGRLPLRRDRAPAAADPSIDHTELTRRLRESGPTQHTTPTTKDHP